MRRYKLIVSLIFLVLVSLYLLIENFPLEEYESTKIVNLEFEIQESKSSVYGTSIVCVYNDLNNEIYRYSLDDSSSKCYNNGNFNITYKYHRNLLGIELRKILKFNQIQ